MQVEPDASRRLLDAESPGEGPQAARELEREAERVARRRRDGLVVRRHRGVRRVGVRLRVRRQTARVVDELDDVVFVLARLEAKLDVALDGVREEIVIGAEAHDGL